MASPIRTNHRVRDKSVRTAITSASTSVEKNSLSSQQEKPPHPSGPQQDQPAPVSLSEKDIRDIITKVLTISISTFFK